MAVQLSIRNVPELERLARRPTAEAWRARVRARKAVTGTRVSARGILAARAADRR